MKKIQTLGLLGVAGAMLVAGIGTTGVKTTAEINATGETTRTIFVNLDNVSWWNDANAWTAVYAWGGDSHVWFNVSQVGDNNKLWEVQNVSTSYTNFIFLRKQPGAPLDFDTGTWNKTVDVSIPLDKNTCKIENGDDEGKKTVTVGYTGVFTDLEENVKSSYFAMTREEIVAPAPGEPANYVMPDHANLESWKEANGRFVPAKYVKKVDAKTSLRLNYSKKKKVFFTNNYSWDSPITVHCWDENGTARDIQMEYSHKNGNGEDVYVADLSRADIEVQKLYFKGRQVIINETRTVDLDYSELGYNNAYYISGNGGGMTSRTCGTWSYDKELYSLSNYGIAFGFTGVDQNFVSGYSDNVKLKVSVNYIGTNSKRYSNYTYFAASAGDNINPWSIVENKLQGAVVLPVTGDSTVPNADLNTSFVATVETYVGETVVYSSQSEYSVNSAAEAYATLGFDELVTSIARCIIANR